MHFGKLFALCLVLAGGLSPSARADEGNWFPFAVETSQSPNTKTPMNYVPLQNATQPWDICVSFPHVKDSYWLAVNYGVSDEAKRLGIGMRLFHAGGYDNLQLQIKQIRRCVDAGGQGVIIGAISNDGLNPLVAELKQKGIPVIDLVNGMSSDQIQAKSLVSFLEMGAIAGTYIAKRHVFGGNKAKVAWLPGPKGAGWVEQGDLGFRQALSKGAAQIIATRHGDTGLHAQTRLLNEVLDKHPNLDYIAGTAVTAEAAVNVLRKRGLSDKVKVVAYYFTPGVQRGIRRGTILAAPTDSAVVQGRIAVDQLVRILEHKPFQAHVGPVVYIVDQDNVSSFDRTSSLAPSGFWPNFVVNRLPQ